MIECECCHKWFRADDLIWDLKEDRMVCISCFARFCESNEMEVLR